MCRVPRSRRKESLKAAQPVELAAQCGACYQHTASRTERTRPVLSYYIMHYYLLIVLLSVLTSLEPILDKLGLSSPLTIERVGLRFDSAHNEESRKRKRKYQLKCARRNCAALTSYSNNERNSMTLSKAR